MNDAMSRRAKLPDFLNWGRQFDENMKAFLIDTWRLTRHRSQHGVRGEMEEESPISAGLDTLCGYQMPALNPLIPAPTTTDESPDFV